MKLTINISPILKQRQLELIKIEEIILGTKNFSRFGEFSFEEAHDWAKWAKKKKIKTVFELDRLFTQEELRHFSSFDLSFLNEFDAIRIKDMGILEFLFKQNGNYSFQLMLEAGHHNLEALKYYQESFYGWRISRLILSSELTLDEIQEIKKVITIPVEILGLGPILLFDSPRSLLAPLVSEEKKQETISAIGKSEESPHKGFVLMENKFGTLMFHFKDLFLLQHLPEIKVHGVDFVRIDFRLEKSSKVFEAFADFWLNPSDLSRDRLQEIWGREWMRGFFLVNKTDVLFSKLKNKHLKKDLSYIGEVKDVVRDKFLVLELTGQGISVDQQIKFITPNGKQKMLHLKKLRNLDNENIESSPKGSLVMIDFVGGIMAKTHVYKEEQLQADLHS